jgi:hypothetical protein
MGMSYSMHGRREMYIRFWRESQKERYIYVDGRIILKWMSER